MGYSRRVTWAHSQADAGSRADGAPEPLPGQLSLPGLEPEHADSRADDDGQAALPGLEDTGAQARPGNADRSGARWPRRCGPPIPTAR